MNIPSNLINDIIYTKIIKAYFYSTTIKNKSLKQYFNIPKLDKMLFVPVYNSTGNNNQKKMAITMDNTYTQAYLFTNEPLNEIMPLLPVRDANVLTITASGDQTLFFLFIWRKSC